MSDPPVGGLVLLAPGQTRGERAAADLAPADGHQRELGSNKESVHEHQRRDRKQKQRRHLAYHRPPHPSLHPPNSGMENRDAESKKRGDPSITSLTRSAPRNRSCRSVLGGSSSTRR